MIRSFWLKIFNFIQSGLVKDISTYILGNILQKLSAFLLIPIYVKYFTPEEYGIWGISTTFAMGLSIICGLGMTGSLMRYYYDYIKQEERLRSYINLSLLLRIITLIIFFFLFLFIGKPIWTYICSGKAPYYPYFYILLIIALTDNLFSFLTLLYRTKFQSSKFVIANTVKTIIQLISSTYLVIFENEGVKGALIGQMGGGVIVCSYLLIIYVKNNRVDGSRIVWSDALHNLKYGVPLIPHEISSWIRGVADRLVLIHYVPLSIVGAYHFGNTGGMILMALIGSIDLAYEPYYYKLKNKSKTETNAILSSYFNIYTALLGSISLVGILFSNEIVKLFASQEYILAARVLPVIIVSYFMYGQYTLIVKPLFYFKMTYYIPFITAVPSLIGLILNLIFVPFWGVDAATWSTFITFGLTLIIVTIISNRIEPLNLKHSFYSTNIVLTLCAIGVVYIDLSSFHIYQYYYKILVVLFYVLFAWHKLLKHDLKYMMNININYLLKGNS